MAGLYISSVFTFLRNCQFVFQSIGTNLYPPVVHAGFSPFTSSETLGIVSLVGFSHFKMSVVISHYGLICITLMTGYAE